MGESHAGSGEFVDVGCFMEGGSITAEVSPAEIVDEEDDDVGFLRSTQRGKKKEAATKMA